MRITIYVRDKRMAFSIAGVADAPCDERQIYRPNIFECRWRVDEQNADWQQFRGPQRWLLA